MKAGTGPTWKETLTLLEQRAGRVDITSLTTPDIASQQAGQTGHEKAGATPASDVMTVAHRVRLLAFRAGGLLVDQPTQLDGARLYQPGTPVRVLAVQDASRWELTTTVISPVRFQLNDQTVVPALMLARPAEARSVQRRAYFRVTAAGVRVEPAELLPLGDLPCDAGFIGPPRVHRPIRVSILNIGGGGMGLEAPQHAGALLPWYAMYHAMLKLPGRDQPLEVPVRRVHLAVQEDGTHYLGVRLEPGDASSRRRCADEICQFTTWLQRQQLQRRREKR